MEDDERFIRAVEYFKRFPGIGERQAKRFTYSLLSQGGPYIKQFSETLSRLFEISHRCEYCGIHYFSEGEREDARCTICGDSSRDKKIALVVGHVSDIHTFEINGLHKGLYIIPGLIFINKPHLNEEQVKKRFKAYIMKNDALEEIIFGYAATPDGDYTVHILNDVIHSLGNNMRVTRLGRGLSTGLEIEYSDTETIESALKGRKEIKEG